MEKYKDRIGNIYFFTPTPKHEYNVKKFGAEGDGRTVDVVAIQRAINAIRGSTLYFPEGIYIVKAGAPETDAILHLAKTGLKICGDGPGVSTIKVADACPTYAWLLGPDTAGTDLSGLEICDLTFDHNIANNPITNEAEIIAWPEYSCGTYEGSGVSIHDLEVINASSMNNIVVNGTGSNHLFQNITCSVIGDDPNHIEHDASFIYVDSSDYSIKNCDLSCASPGLLGERCAIETHGTDYTVENNTTLNFEVGMNITGVSDVTAENVLVNNNDISGCYLGIVLWSNQYGGHVAGYGIDGCAVTYNTIDIEPCGGVGDTKVRGGIIIDYNSDLDLNDITIDHNDITDTLETVAGGSNDVSLGIGWYSTTGNKLSNSLITNNTLTNFPNAAIRLSSCDLDTVAITGNTFTDCGSTMAAMVDPYRTPIFIGVVNSDTLTISNNAFVDDIAVTRIPYFMYLTAATTSDDFVIDGNTFSITGDKVVFVRHIEVDGAVSRPTITGTIDDFVPPWGNVKHPVTLIHDLGTEWTVDVDEVTWSQV